jgi:membrane protease YdiL (CAAX protease family)
MTRDRRRLALFFGVTFGVSWAYWFAVLASTRHWIGYRVPLTPFGAFGPAVAAVVSAATIGGRAELGQLLRRFRFRGVTWRGLALAVGIWPLLVAAAIAGASAPGVPAAPAPQVSLALAILVFIEVLIFTSVGEELGWRGYALPILLARDRPLFASTIVGAVWAIWHLPLFWIPGTAQAAFPFGYFALSILATSFVYTAVFRLTQPSIIPVLLLHASQDASLNIAQIGWPQATAGGTFWLSYFGMVIAAGVVAALAGPSSSNDVLLAANTVPPPHC